MRRVTVWYDGACPLCRREIALMKALDVRCSVDFVNVADERDADLCPMDPADLLARFHAQEAGKPIVSGAAAFATVWRALPLLSPFGALALFPPVLWLLERVYRAFLTIRPQLQRMTGP